ncbi:PD-(D/E)XK nuclease family protein [Candidatus Giovannonibacteria bacterium]|nr:PD-(D/E)XK nuclease family protein [Candidatus Giovannonibacteria bacterium]
MSKFYNAKRKRNLYIPDSEIPYKISRSKIDLFLKCPKCFYFDRRLGVGQPPGMPFSLNSAVDKLLKKEFDIHRANETAHPLMKAYGLNLVPFPHEKIDEWRDALGGGIQYLDQGANLVITGAIDDVWHDQKGELYIVDYKATSKEGEVNLDADWQIGYKRQMEIYQWLFRKNNFKVSDTGYFVYANGDSDKEAFDGKLEFDIKIIPYKGSDAWVPEVIKNLHKCLISDEIPKSSPDCDFCAYRNAALELEVNKVSQ